MARKTSVGKDAQTREDRLKSALKANLARRKAQARARADADSRGEDDSASGADNGKED
ncbi:hypothetical protein [Pseudooceanicola sp. 200-1SW]|uniref:hypothetical protein n=1 Tax=Pseudooceanicola sp. 200-1SW TaxID=3425949 RepID=UPI003D7FD75A